MPEALHERLRRNLQGLARRKGLYLTHLPDRAGVSHTQFFKILKGTSSPRLSYLEKLADALDEDVSALLKP
jgi:transcriptional regulator with XRE-family HTH domain